MGPKQAIVTCLRRKPFTFSGRATRAEFWWFMLFFALLVIALNSLPLLLYVTVGFEALAGAGFGLLPVLVLLLTLLLYVPLLAALTRRFHDVTLSGWLVLLGLVASVAVLFLPALFVRDGLVSLVVSIAFLLVCLLPGARGPNRFGPDPKTPPDDADIFA